MKISSFFQRISSNVPAIHCLALAIVIAAGATTMAADKPNIVILTDISSSTTEPDDYESMVRLMVYANEFEILGLISNSSVYGKKRLHPEFTRQIIDAYGKVRSNLLLHETGYPTTQALHNVVATGQAVYGMEGIGKDKDSEGSELIVSILDKNDDPVWFLGWGGMNTLAQALWKIQNTRSAEELKSLIAKVRIYDIAGQDDSIAWMLHTFPDVYAIRSGFMFLGLSPHPYKKETWGGNEDCITKEWYHHNVQDNHGSLGAIYPDHKWMVEGDTSSFMFLFDNGLNPDHIPWWGSWAGRFARQKVKNPRTYSVNTDKYNDFYMYYDNSNDEVWAEDAPDYFAGRNAPYNGNKYAAIFRWREHFQNDFAARMDWCVKSYKEANHPPVANVTGQLLHTTPPGETVKLSAEGSSDPDGDELSYHWYFYRSAGTFNRDISIENATSINTGFTVPATAAKGDEIHIILTVQDNGHPKLTRYKRVVITVE